LTWEQRIESYGAITKFPQSVPMIGWSAHGFWATICRDRGFPIDEPMIENRQSERKILPTIL
jgi:hypothetical protein